MQRRSFIGTVLGTIAGLLGIGKAKAVVVTPRKLDEATVPWIIERLWEDVQRPFNAGVRITSYHCGDGNCPAPKCFYEGFDATTEGNGADDEGFAVIVTTPKHRYRISVKADYLGCTCSSLEPLPGETWTRGCDLADGGRTVETWQRIVADIKRMENTGSMYKMA